MSPPWGKSWECVASSPSHSQILSRRRLSPQLQHKIWEWPGDKAREWGVSREVTTTGKLTVYWDRKPWQEPANKAIAILCVCVLNQKLPKSMHRRCLLLRSQGCINYWVSCFEFEYQFEFEFLNIGESILADLGGEILLLPPVCRGQQHTCSNRVCFLYSGAPVGSWECCITMHWLY